MLQFIMVYSFVFLAAISAKADKETKNSGIVKKNCGIHKERIRFEGYDGFRVRYTEVVFSCGTKETQTILCRGLPPINLESCMKNPFDIGEWQKHKDETLYEKMDANQRGNREIKGPSR